MGTKRLIKLLMGQGIQRNDARVFTEVYQKVKYSSVIRLFPELILPQPVKVETHETPIVKLCAKQFVSKSELKATSFDMEGYIQAHLKQRIICALEQGQAIRYRREEEAMGVEYKALLYIALPPH